MDSAGQMVYAPRHLVQMAFRDHPNSTVTVIPPVSKREQRQLLREAYKDIAKAKRKARGLKKPTRT